MTTLVETKSKMNEKRVLSEQIIQARIEFFKSTMNSWLNPRDGVFSTEEMFEIFNCLEAMIWLLTGTKWNEVLIPTLVYADRYVSASGTKLGKESVFRLLSVTTWVSLKFWADTSFKIDEVRKITEIPVSKLKELELKLLNQIEWNLMFTDVDIVAFGISNLWKLKSQ